MSAPTGVVTTNGKKSAEVIVPKSKGGRTELVNRERRNAARQEWKKRKYT